jgi:hypothetical protein
MTAKHYDVITAKHYDIMDLDGPSIGNCAEKLCVDILRPNCKLHQCSVSNRLTYFRTDPNSSISSSMTSPTGSSVVSSLGSQNVDDSGTANNTDNNSEVAQYVRTIHYEIRESDGTLIQGIAFDQDTRRYFTTELSDGLKARILTSDCDEFCYSRCTM